MGSATTGLSLAIEPSAEAPAGPQGYLTPSRRGLFRERAQRHSSIRIIRAIRQKMERSITCLLCLRGCRGTAWRAPAGLSVSGSGKPIGGTRPAWTTCP